MKKVLPVGLIVLGVVGFLLYIVNPSGTATLDPRARVLGFVPYSIPSASMLPTLEVGDYVLVSAYAYRKKAPEHEDVVVYTPPIVDAKFVGRVVAVPGDIVSVAGGKVVINGEPQQESFIQLTGRNCQRGDVQNITVPEGKLFVMGDNRCNSNDSRFWGFADTDTLVGRVVATF